MKVPASEIQVGDLVIRPANDASYRVCGVIEMGNWIALQITIKNDPPHATLQYQRHELVERIDD